MKSLPQLLTCVVIALLISAGAGASVQAQTWPARPITLIVGFGAGSSVDTVGRIIANVISTELGQPVIVENRQAGGGAIASIDVLKAPPDGYTLLLQAIGPMILRPIIDPAVGYDPQKDFTPVVMLGETPNVILGGSQFPAQTVKEAVDWARKNPDRLTIGHPGIGTMGHLAALLLASKTGITGTYVAYRSGTQMLPDLLGGRIDIAVLAYTPQLKAARIYAVMTPDPVDFLPGVPSMREAGFPGIYATVWFALFGPPKLPPEIANRLNLIVNAYLRSADGQKRFASQGIQTLGGSSEQLAKKMDDDQVLWSKVIKDANIKLNDQK